MARELDLLGGKIATEVATPKPSWFLPTVLREPVPVDFTWHAVHDRNTRRAPIRFQHFSMDLGKLQDIGRLNPSAKGDHFQAESTAHFKTIGGWTELRMAKIALEEYFRERLEASIGHSVRMVNRTSVATMIEMADHIRPPEPPRAWVIAQLLLAHPTMTRREAEVLTEDELAKAPLP